MSQAILLLMVTAKLSYNSRNAFDHSEFACRTIETTNHFLDSKEL